MVTYAQQWYSCAAIELESWPAMAKGGLCTAITRVLDRNPTAGERGVNLSRVQRHRVAMMQMAGNGKGWPSHSSHKSAGLHSYCRRAGCQPEQGAAPQGGYDANGRQWRRVAFTLQSQECWTALLLQASGAST